MSDATSKNSLGTTEPRPGPIILGIDPGTRLAGFAFLQARTPRPLTAKDFTILDAGVMKFTAKDPINNRLGMLHNTVFKMAGMHQPDYCVIEQAFYGVNLQSTLRLGEARGACLAAFYRLGAKVHEMSPNHMKKAITGRGHASKEEVAFAVKQLLQFERKELPFDVTDAMALALSFGLALATLEHLAPQKASRRSNPEAEF